MIVVEWMGDDVSSGSVEVRLLGGALEVKGLNNLWNWLGVSVVTGVLSRGGNARVIQFSSPAVVLLDQTWSD